MTRPGRWRRWHLGRALQARPRLVVAIATATAGWLLLRWLDLALPEARLLIAWNLLVGVHQALLAPLLGRADPSEMQRRALQQDEGEAAVLLLVVLSAAAVLLSVASQLAAARDLHGAARVWHLGLAALTVTSSWLFTQTLFALHYAHRFYAERAAQQPDPLSFPGTADPRYPDFLYFACVIGTSGQTADVAFQGSSLRGTGTLHCVLAYFFNATLLALAINILAGLL